MKFEQYTTGTSWQVLKSIAEKPRSASEIARTIGASIANVSQRARLLEAHGVITRTKEQHAGKGKPHQRYAITKPVTLLASIAQGTARKRTFTPNEFQEQLLNILNWPRQEDQFFLLKFLCLHEE
ncbi:ArsR family transcriptional regulator, partial [Candidatus Woesearchaeota archaeon]